jgi:hypothetical protein
MLRAAASVEVHPKTGPSGIRMVIFGTLFKSGFRMALAATLVRMVGPSLDRFIQKKIFLYV